MVYHLRVKEVGQAQFVVEKLWVEPSIYYVGGQVKFNASIKNTGTADGYCQYEFTINGEKFGLKSVYIGAGQSVTVTEYYTFRDTQSRTLKITANGSTKSITVKANPSTISIPPEATHYVVLKLAPVIGLTPRWDWIRSTLNSAVTTAFTKTVNYFGSNMGWQLVGSPALYLEGAKTPVGTVPENEGWVFVFLKKTSSPVSFITSFVIVLLALLIGGAVYCYSASLRESATARKIEAMTEYEIVTGSKELADKGVISSDQYASIVKATQQGEKPATKTIWESLGEMLGMPADQVRAIATAIGAIFGLMFFISLLK